MKNDKKLVKNKKKIGKKNLRLKIPIFSLFNNSFIKIYFTPEILEPILFNDASEQFLKLIKIVQLSEQFL